MVVSGLRWTILFPSPRRRQDSFIPNSSFLIFPLVAQFLVY